MTEPQHAVAQRMLEEDAASREMGIELLELADGYARTQMTVKATMVNGHGLTHGGFVFALADTTFALACNSHGQTAVAARADIRFLAPTREGDVLVAVAQERFLRGRTGMTDVTVTLGDEVIAEFRGDSRVITIPAR